MNTTSANRQTENRLSHNQLSQGYPQNQEIVTRTTEHVSRQMEVFARVKEQDGETEKEWLQRTYMRMLNLQVAYMPDMDTHFIVGSIVSVNEEGKPFGDGKRRMQIIKVKTVVHIFLIKQ